MKPYYETPDSSIRIFHARWEDVLAAGVFAPKDIALIHADPPYGNGFLAMNNSVKSSKARRWNPDKCDGFTWKKIEGDDKPFDPAELLALKRPTILWAPTITAIVYQALAGGLYGTSARISRATTTQTWKLRGQTLEAQRANSRTSGMASRERRRWDCTCIQRRSPRRFVPGNSATPKVAKNSNAATQSLYHTAAQCPSSSPQWRRVTK